MDTAGSSPAPGAGPSTLPPRPRRDSRLDIVRGWLQLSIFASHASGSWIGAWLIHGRWGLSDSSEQFVFLSGFMLGSVFARKQLRDGWRGAAADLLGRAGRLYRTHLAVFALFGLAVVAAGATLLPGEAARMGWQTLLTDPRAALPLALLTLYQPNFMGILPLFVWCMLLLPPFAGAVARWGNRVLAVPLGLYAAAWAVLLATPAAARWEAGIGFDPFTWQALFLLGAWLGRRALLHGRAVPAGGRWLPAVTAAAIAVLLAGLLLRRGLDGALPDLLDGKKDLGPGRFLHAMALAWLVATLVPREAAWMHRALPRALAMIGRHSLSVFCLGLFLSWAATVAFRLLPATPLLDPLAIGTGALLLTAFAAWRERASAGLRIAAPA